MAESSHNDRAFPHSKSVHAECVESGDIVRHPSAVGLFCPENYKQEGAQ